MLKLSKCPSYYSIGLKNGLNKKDDNLDETVVYVLVGFSGHTHLLYNDNVTK